MKIMLKFYALLFLLILIGIIYGIILYLFLEIISPSFAFFSLASLGFLGISGIQAIIKKENIEYQVEKKRYNTKQEAHDALTRGIKLTLITGIAFAILSILGLLLSKYI